MRIHILSDLHREFDEVEVPDVDCDCVILAGDVATKRHGLHWIQKRFRNVPVIYVCGNHEFYGESLPSLTKHLREEARGTNVHFLEDEFVSIDGVHFFGCTLWTDMALQGDWITGAIEAGSVMNDYKRVRNSDEHYRRLGPRDTRLMHLASLQAMQRFLESHNSRHSVIVTHHAPSMRSLPESRRTELVSCAYASHLDAFIEKHQPQLWVHGHIHHRSDYYIGGTRVVANPRAYPGQPNEGFLADLVISVDGE